MFVVISINVFIVCFECILIFVSVNDSYNFFKSIVSKIFLCEHLLMCNIMFELIFET